MKESISLPLVMLVLLLSALPASAAPTVMYKGSYARAIEDLTVSGTVYDVDFVWQRFTTAAASMDFTSPVDAKNAVIAMTAALNAASPLPMFVTDAEYPTSNSSSQAYILYEETASDYNTYKTQNPSLMQWQGRWESLDKSTSPDFGMIAHFTPSQPAIPAPGALLLSGIGVGVMGYLRRRRAL